MPIVIGTELRTPPVFLAPLAGITDLPFRSLVSRFGAGLVVSEMVASQELVQARPSARARAELGTGEANTSVQIAGRDAYWMAECARLVEGQGARIIDINMGCPAKKVTNGYSGSALMREPDHALRLIEAVVAAVKVPVSVKMRLGWDDESLNAPELASRAEAAGVSMVTIHGRTRCQFYKGAADWSKIRRVVDAVDIPVIANGDVVDTASARSALAQSAASGVMVGRGAQGRPWALAEIAHDIYGTLAPAVPQGVARLELIEEHYNEMIAFYGPELGGKCARKHLGWYMDDLTAPPGLRREILTAPTPGKTISLIRKIDVPDLRSAA